MKTMALITGILCLMVFMTMITVMVLAPFYIADMSISKVLEIRGYGLMLMASPVIGLGLILAAYEGEYNA